MELTKDAVSLGLRSVLWHHNTKTLGYEVRSTSVVDIDFFLLNLTSSGHALVEKSFALQNKVVGAMAGVMSDDELALVGAVMHRVEDAIDELVGRHASAE